MNGRSLFLVHTDNNNERNMRPYTDAYVPMNGYQRKVESFGRLDSLVEMLEDKRRR